MKKRINLTKITVATFMIVGMSFVGGVPLHNDNVAVAATENETTNRTLHGPELTNATQKMEERIESSGSNTKISEKQLQQMYHEAQLTKTKKIAAAKEKKRLAEIAKVKAHKAKVKRAKTAKAAKVRAATQRKTTSQRTQYPTRSNGSTTKHRTSTYKAAPQRKAAPQKRRASNISAYIKISAWGNLGNMQALVNRCSGPVAITGSVGLPLLIAEHNYCGGSGHIAARRIGQRVNVSGYGTYRVVSRKNVVRGTSSDVIRGMGSIVLQTCVGSTINLVGLSK